MITYDAAKVQELKAENERLRAELQAANLTIEARTARLAEARAELADLHALVDAYLTRCQGGTVDTQSIGTTGENES